MSALIYAALQETEPHTSLRGMLSWSYLRLSLINFHHLLLEHCLCIAMNNLRYEAQLHHRPQLRCMLYKDW